MQEREAISLAAITKTIEAIHELKYKMGDTFDDPKLQHVLGLLHGAQAQYKQVIKGQIRQAVSQSLINHRF